jgi:superfamily II DNA/RNA helicase
MSLLTKHIKGARSITAPVPKNSDHSVGSDVSSARISINTNELSSVDKTINVATTLQSRSSAASSSSQRTFQRREKIHMSAPKEAEDNAIITGMYKKLGGTIQIAGYDEEEPCQTFSSMNLKPELLKGIHIKLGWEFPSPIQSAGIKPVISRRDLLCQAHTGTGKTGTYMIAGLQNIDPSIKTTQMLVFAPTRELTVQIYDVASNLAEYMDISIAAHIGGNTGKDSRGVDYLHNVKPDNDCGTYSEPPYGEGVMICTPGRGLKLISKGYIKTENVALVVLDEADKMLGQGFMDDIINIFKQLPDNVQIALYSATLSHEIKTITKSFMNNPVSILIATENVMLDNQIQYVVKVSNEEDKAETIKTIFGLTAIGQVMIFCNRKYKIDHVVGIINELGITVGGLHADLDQSVRDSNMNKFKDGSIKVLVCTDVAARGIDTKVDLVINYDIPSDAEQYVHRCGRTGRFGKAGLVINLVFETETHNLNKITGVYRIKMHPFSQFAETQGSLSRSIK